MARLEGFGDLMPDFFLCVFLPIQRDDHKWNPIPEPLVVGRDVELVNSSIYWVVVSVSHTRIGTYNN